MRVAVLTTRLVDRPAGGGEICSARLLGELGAMADSLLVVGRGSAGPGRAAIGPVVPPLADWPAWRRGASLAAALATRRAWTVQRLSAGGAARRVAALLDAAAPEIVVVDHLQAFAWLGALRRLPPLLLVMHNLESVLYREERRQARSAAARWVLEREARALWALETAALRAAGAVACLSEDDAEALREAAAQAGAAPLVAVLPGYPLAPVQEPPIQIQRPGARRRIGLIGTWTWAPNRHALEWMLAEVRPRLPAHCELVLAGAGLDRLVLPPRVRSLGRVAHVEDFYAAVDVIAVPTLGGSGVQEKAIEAIASRRAVVATPQALRGLHPLPASVRVAATAAGFAAACASAPPIDAAAASRWAKERRARYRAVLARCVTAALARPGSAVDGSVATRHPDGASHSDSLGKAMVNSENM